MDYLTMDDVKDVRQRRSGMLDDAKRTQVLACVKEILVKQHYAVIKAGRADSGWELNNYRLSIPVQYHPAVADYLKERGFSVLREDGGMKIWIR